MRNAYPQRNTQPDVEYHDIRIQGAGASNPTKELGNGVTLTREGTGQYRITWSDSPGNFKGATYGLQAATPGNLAGHTVVFDTYDSSNLQLDFYLYNASDTAHDLAANEYITVTVNFSTSAVDGA